MPTFRAIHLNDVLMNRIVELGLFPSDANLTGRDLLQSNLGRRRDIQAQLFNQDLVGRLTYLPCTVQ